MEKCELLYKQLKDENIRAYIDKREITPGSKYYGWELKGVPMRVEIGPKDIEEKQIVIVRRDTGEKKSILQKDALNNIKEEFDKISKNLYNNAKLTYGKTKDIASITIKPIVTSPMSVIML